MSTMKSTPMMGQYMKFKQQYPDKIVLFRMGDFFETFGDDAKIASKVLNITLTARDKKNNPTPLAGFPHRAIDQYLPKLVNAGHCVVVVDQLEDPKLAKGIVKRGVVRVVTPGTLDGDQANDIKNSYLVAFNIDKKSLGVSLCDISTGEFLTMSLPFSKGSINAVLSSYDPVEVLLIEGTQNLNLGSIPIQILDKGLGNIAFAKDLIERFFNIKSLDSLNLEDDAQLVSVGMILKYIGDTQLMNPKHIEKPKTVNINGSMILDRSTVRNLELVTNSYSGVVKDSLFSVINNCQTRMGSRLLYHWLLNPLLEKKSIDKRLDMVDRMAKDRNLLDGIREELSSVSDIERIIGKIGLGRVNARDFNALEISLGAVIRINDLLKDKYIPYMDTLRSVIESISNVIADDPPTLITEGRIIKDGYNKELDELRNISGSSKGWIKEFEEAEKKKTGISSLKIGFNRVFGYFIEVTKAHQEKVPESYIRKQTLVNCERYITEELKEKEDIILNAQERIGQLEYNLFCEFRDTFISKLDKLQKVARKIARLDALSGFAYLSITSNYSRPQIFDLGENNGLIDIKNGRHPIIESIIQEDFVSNDTVMDFEGSSMCILTGPNMSGKSTYIRQVATIVLLAQIGCFVPASSATISIVDRIFTRVGAADDLSRGRSTFMVEMDEAANIVNNATKYSLVVLDEVGRGTSTYDGVSIAWSLAEFLVTDIKCRTLFATHYHELLKLAQRMPDRIKNFNVLVEEDLDSGTVIFLRKIVQGGTDRSYGIYVAKMAGLPEKILHRANDILESFEQEKMFNREGVLNDREVVIEKKKEVDSTLLQYPLFTAKDSEIERDIQGLDIDNMTPMEALGKISEWKKKV